MWHLLICFVHRNYEGRACTQNETFGIALGPYLGLFPKEQEPGAQRRAASAASQRHKMLHMRQTTDCT